MSEDFGIKRYTDSYEALEQKLTAVERERDALRQNLDATAVANFMAYRERVQALVEAARALAEKGKSHWRYYDERKALAAALKPFEEK